MKLKVQTKIHLAIIRAAPDCSKWEQIEKLIARHHVERGRLGTEERRQKASKSQRGGGHQENKAF